mmetsp:Transcript_11460/g.19393  ORF Transcript_11460/g.19393 Transcript_11460/m.19393 type:complete len:111 (+) Transcript_11460:280-612(+)
MSDEMKMFVGELPPKTTRKRTFSFERLNLLVMPLIKFKEGEKDLASFTTVVKEWLQFLQGLKNISINTQFESMLNLYLLLSEATVLKSVIFVSMVTFLQKHGQLEQVMIK